MCGSVTDPTLKLRTHSTRASRGRLCGKNHNVCNKQRQNTLARGGVMRADRIAPVAIFYA